MAFRYCCLVLFLTLAVVLNTSITSAQVPTLEMLAHTGDPVYQTLDSKPNPCYIGGIEPTIRIIRAGAALPKSDTDPVYLGYDKVQIIYTLDPEGFQPDFLVLHITNKSGKVVFFQYKSKNEIRTGTDTFEWDGRWSEPPHATRFARPDMAPYSIRLELQVNLLGGSTWTCDSNTVQISATQLKAKAVIGTTHSKQHIRTIKGQLQRMGFNEIYADANTSAKLLANVSNGLVLYIFGHGGADDPKDPSYGAITFSDTDRVTAADLEGRGLKYLIVFLNNCLLSPKDGEQGAFFPEAFGIQHNDGFEVGWNFIKDANRAPQAGEAFFLTLLRTPDPPKTGLDALNAANDAMEPVAGDPALLEGDGNPGVLVRLK